MILNHVTVLSIILFLSNFSFAQTYVFTEQGLALEMSGGAVLVYDIPPKYNVEPTYPVLFPKQSSNVRALSEESKGQKKSLRGVVGLDSQSHIKNETKISTPKYLDPVDRNPIENNILIKEKNNFRERTMKNKFDQQYIDGIYLFNKTYISSWPVNIQKFVTAPSRWDRNDWLLSASVAGSLGILMVLDKRIKNFWQTDLRHSDIDSFLGYAEPFGDTNLILAGSLGTYMVSELLNAKREKGASLMLFQAVTLGSALGEGLKRVSGRTRPSGTNSNPHPNSTDFNGFDSGNNDAFPSGHSIVSFATATVVSETYKDDYAWVPWLAYPSASLVAAHRINDNRHWASDVVFGAILGHLIAKLVVKNNVFWSNKNLSLYPMNLQNGGGVGVSFRY